MFIDISEIVREANIGVCLPFAAFIPLISAAVSAAGSMAASRSAAKSNERAADKTNNLQREMYYDQQRYNTPQAQMQRYRLAGLNPHLIYSQSNANTQAIPSMVTPNYDITAQGAMSAFQGFQGALNQGAEFLLTRAQVDNQIIANRMAALDERMKNIDLDWYEVEKKTNNELLRQTIRKTKSEIRTIRYNLANTLPQQYENLKSQKDLTDEQRLNILFQNSIATEQMKLAWARLGLDRAISNNNQFWQNIISGFLKSYGINSFEDLGSSIGKSARKSLVDSILDYISNHFFGDKPPVQGSSGGSF